jgi:hypothetical protein
MGVAKKGWHIVAVVHVVLWECRHRDQYLLSLPVTRVSVAWDKAKPVHDIEDTGSAGSIG